MEYLFRALEHFPIGSILSVSLPGLTGQSSTLGLRVLDRPVKPGDDRTVLVNLKRKMR
jgi:hypothetical protein